jgi:integrase
MHKLKTLFSKRMVPVNPELLKEINTYADSRKSTYVFGEIIKSGKKKGKIKHFSRNASINFINEYARECSTLRINIGFHSTRRTYASILSAEGISLSAISQLLGHASITITITYLNQIKILDFTEIQKVITNM